MARGIANSYGIRTEGNPGRVVTRDRIGQPLATTRISRVGERYEMAEGGRFTGTGLTWKDEIPGPRPSRPAGRVRRR